MKAFPALRFTEEWFCVRTPFFFPTQPSNHDNAQARCYVCFGAFQPISRNVFTKHLAFVVNKERDWRYVHRLATVNDRVFWNQALTALVVSNASQSVSLLQIKLIENITSDISTISNKNDPTRIPRSSFERRKCRFLISNNNSIQLTPLDKQMCVFSLFIWKNVPGINETSPHITKKLELYKFPKFLDEEFKDLYNVWKRMSQVKEP